MMFSQDNSEGHRASKKYAEARMGLKTARMADRRAEKREARRAKVKTLAERPSRISLAAWEKQAAAQQQR
jgi:hypothetical protein